MEIIYVLKQDRIIKGPFSLEALQKRGVKQTEKVWFKGLNDWTPINDIPTLQNIPKIIVVKTQLNFFQKIFSFLK
jgi:hypothetical protein